MAFAAAGPLRGTAAVPGDKSISHRALMLAAMARGRSRIEGLSEGTDVGATADALRAMGAGVAREPDGSWSVDGVGTGCLVAPARALDMGNSGTSTRLLIGLLAAHNVTATFTGDASLCRRPMDRVIAPLARLGVEVSASGGGRLPLTLRGRTPLVPAVHRLTIASAQVKSALLLAGLNTPGITRVIEPAATRDHSERMLRRFGAEIEAGGEGERHIALRGEAELRPQSIVIPADPSSAAFLIAAALIVPGSEVRIEGVGVNPMRIGLFEMLRHMGADIAFSNRREAGGEPVADLVARHSALRAVDVPPEIVPAMIDEFPILFVAAAFASGTTRTTGLSELRIKESDRIGAMAAGLRAIGAAVEEQQDGLTIRGSGGEPLAGGASIDPRLDHRIAMAVAIAALHCRAPVTIDDMAAADTSFPGFAAALKGLSL
jgi:3-phosphoshikimate 1-carboxyvinyltransferase